MRAGSIARWMPLTLVAVVAAVIVLTGRPARVEVIEGADRFPSETLDDVVSYADVVALVRVRSERARPVDPNPDISGGTSGATSNSSSSKSSGRARTASLLEAL